MFNFMVLTIGEDGDPHTRSARSTNGPRIRDTGNESENEDELPNDLQEAEEDALKHIDFDWWGSESHFVIGRFLYRGKPI